MRLCLVFLAACITRGLTTPALHTSNENFGVLVDALLAVAETFSTCKTSESVLSVRDALENQQKTLRELLGADVKREPPQCDATHDPDQQQAIQLLRSQLQMVQQSCDAVEGLVKKAVDQVREEFVLRLRQEIETLNTQLLEEKQKNAGQDSSVEELRRVAADTGDKLRELKVTVSSVQEDLNQNTLSKGDFGCPSPFLSLGPDCLYIHHHSALTWDESRNFCKQIGADLAAPSDVIKLKQFLLKYGHKKNFWLGATDRKVEGVFRWVTGAKMDLPSSSWRAGEPNNGNGGEDCVHYRAQDMLLNDAECYHSKFFICQAQRL